MSIYATLRTTPTCNHTHEVIYITRGATAELIYPLYDKVFRFEDIEQITFTFKQGKTIYWYSMFTPGEDETVETDSHFYHFNNAEYGAIIFNFGSEETKLFKEPTIPGAIAPPKYSLFLLTARSFVAVPRSTTSKSPGYLLSHQLRLHSRHHRPGWGRTGCLHSWSPGTCARV